MKRSTRLWISLGAALGIALGGLPAQASEVVKLARLVMSVKRSSNDAPRPPANEARSSTAASPQSHGNGGSDAAGTAPAPARGVS